MGTMATNETSASPTAQQSIETPVFTPNQTQQMGTETTNETPSKPNQAEENLNDEGNKKRYDSPWNRTRVEATVFQVLLEGKFSR
ncbi:hypothetical protein YC2023_098248 [Brassica napus]